MPTKIEHVLKVKQPNGERKEVRVIETTWPFDEVEMNLPINVKAILDWEQEHLINASVHVERSIIKP